MSVLHRIIELHAYAEEQYINAKSVTLSQKSYDDLVDELPFIPTVKDVDNAPGQIGQIDGLNIVVIEGNHDHIVIS